MQSSAKDFLMHVRYRTLDTHIRVTSENPAAEQIASAISSATGADPQTIKLLVSGHKDRMIRLLTTPTQTAQELGLVSGMRATVYASTKAEISQVQNSRDLPGLAGFEQELKQTMRRQRGSRNGTLKLPAGPYTFQKFEAWQRPGLSPVLTEGLKLLHRLAADPGIVGIMSKHRWTVGLLSEMPPEGKVGVSPVCILGVNINAGQEISLRLRTDDLKGFRRYDRIRETLCHELAHMVWGEHDNRFKQLNSQLLKECGQLDWTGHAGLAVSGLQEAAFANPAEPTWVDEDDVMAVTAQSSGQSLRQLAGGDAQPHGRTVTDPRRAAAMAASARLASANASPSTSKFTNPEATASRSTNNQALGLAGVEGESSAHTNATSAEAAAGTEVALNPEADIASMGHHDPTTEQAEEAMRALGSMDFAAEAQCVQQDDHKGDDNLHQASQARLQQQHGFVADALQNVQSPADKDVAMPDASMLQQQQPDQAHAAPDFHRQQAGHQSPAGAHKAHAAVSTGTDTVLLEQPTGQADTAASRQAVGTVSHEPDANLHSRQAHHSPEAAFKQADHSRQAAPTQADPNVEATFTQAHHSLQAASAQADHSLQAASQEVDGSSSLDADDPAVQRYRQAEAALAQLKTQAGVAGQQAALQTLAKILQNIASHPGEAKYSHIRLGNAVFYTRAGQFPAALELLRVAGFSEQAEGLADKALVWKRNDHGLLWLTLSAVNSALQSPA